MSDVEQMGPIDFLIVEFPGTKMTGKGLPLLANLVDRGIIRILDLVFVRKLLDGSVTAVALTDLDVESKLYLAIFEGSSSGLVDDGDIDEAGRVLEPGTSAAILVYENVWAAPLAVALRHSGGQLVASGRIPVQALLAALDAADAADAETGAAHGSAARGSTPNGSSRR
ncbi:MAG: hypothetical protein V7637_2495 [Mycobacteriales bacterium]|jgi:hypothetical protein